MGPSKDEDKRPRRKHLRRLREVFVERPVFLITVCTTGRRPLLTDPKVVNIVHSTLREAAQRNGWHVGRYVIMPDHVHFFCAPGGEERSLSAFVGGFKEARTRKMWEVGWGGRMWQREFFDHLLRSDESHAQKWEYVRDNPVRARLCQTAEDWPHQGEIEVL